MQPVETPRESSVTYTHQSGEVYPLPAFLNDYGEVGSVWELDDAERAAVAAGGRLQLLVDQEPPPPVALRIVGPWCPCADHQHEMTWVAQLETWGCPQEEADE